MIDLPNKSLQPTRKLPRAAEAQGLGYELLERKENMSTNVINILPDSLSGPRTVGDILYPLCQHNF